ncbi:LysR family transcriptional regulator [Pseudaminobacter salicylatoxidans]|uniref:LysR family transcriptional regulator n=1 Tax=Pseudaminobacter salicylatoxidans TaxID=93369 RepID=UPI003CC77029
MATISPMIDRQGATLTSLGSRIPMTSPIQTLAVAEYLNFRHAANALGVAQSSVSARVKTLKKTSASFCSSATREASD